MRLAWKREYFYWIVPVAVVLFATGAWLFKSDALPTNVLTVHPQQFEQQISVSGTVQAAQDVDLGFSAAGRISHVYAAVGDHVKAGQVVAETDNSDLRAALAQKEAALAMQQAKLDSLRAGTRPEQIAVTQAQVNSDATALMQSNAAVIDAIQNAYTACDDAVHNKVDQFFNNPHSSNPTLGFAINSAQLGMSLVADRVAAETMLATWQVQISSLTSSSDLTSAESQAQANLGAVVALLADANAALNVAIPSAQADQTELSTYIANVAVARTAVNTAAAAVTADISAQKAAASALVKEQKNLALEQAGSTAQDIAAQVAQVEAAQADVGSARAQLAKTIITAPFDGIVTRMDAKVGEVISPTSQEISMISTGLFQIQTYIPEVEMVGLAVGNPATTTLDAYGPKVPFAATVISIDPAETVVNGVSTYKTMLQFLNADPRLKSGMTASVTIVTQVLPNALVVPQGALYRKGSDEMIDVIRGKSVVAVPVTTSGASALGNVAVTAGLEDGDVVVLDPKVTH